VRKQKYDQEDARLLLKLMMEDRFPRVWVPGVENRDLRQLLWHRHRRLCRDGDLFSLDTADAFIEADLSVLACKQGRQRQHLVCRRKSEQLLSEDQVEGSRFKCSLPHEQRTSNTGTNVRPYGVSEYRTRRGKPCS
jgi:hypothetical protein